jgi:hypothetical protein
MDQSKPVGWRYLAHLALLMASILTASFGNADEASGTPSHTMGDLSRSSSEIT